VLCLGPGEHPQPPLKFQDPSQPLLTMNLQKLVTTHLISLLPVDICSQGRKMRARKAPDHSNAEQDTITSPPKKKPKTKDTPVEDTEFKLPAGSQDVEVLSTAPSSAFSVFFNRFLTLNISKCRQQESSRRRRNWWRCCLHSLNVRKLSISPKCIFRCLCILSHHPPCSHHPWCFTTCFYPL
jgi:hypothetical protein